MNIGQSKMRAATQAAVVLGLVAAGALLLHGAEGHGETVTLERRPLPMAEGLELDFKMSQQRPRSDTYTARVRLMGIDRGLKQEPSRVRYRWEIFNRERMRGQNEMGHVTTMGLHKGNSLDPWWANGQDMTTAHTHMWLSQSACQELRRKGVTQYAVDVTQRRDNDQQELRRDSEEDFEVRIDGRTMTLRTMKLVNEHNDALWVLNDCENPLVLKINIPGYYQWALSEARTGKPIHKRR